MQRHPGSAQGASRQCWRRILRVLRVHFGSAQGAFRQCSACISAVLRVHFGSAHGAPWQGASLRQIRYCMRPRTESWLPRSSLGHATIAVPGAAARSTASAAASSGATSARWTLAPRRASSRLLHSPRPLAAPSVAIADKQGE
eukprot:366295-Chlamydomonas_euryale.AAC.2